MYFLGSCGCCSDCICGQTVSCRTGNPAPRLEFTFGNNTIGSKCLSNTSLSANGLIPGGLPDGNKLPTPFADPSIAVWTCVDGQYEIYTNLGTCFLTIYMSITPPGDCATGDDFDFQITGWDNHGCPDAGAVVSIAVFYDNCT